MSIDTLTLMLIMTLQLTARHAHVNWQANVNADNDVTTARRLGYLVP